MVCLKAGEMERDAMISYSYIKFYDIMDIN